MNKASSKKIKVGIFIDGGFIPSYDGATNRFQYLSRHLQKNGIDVVIFYCYRGWSDIELIKKEPFKTYLFPIESYYNNLDLIANLVKKESIDIIQFNDLEPILSHGIKLSNITKTHLVAEMHYVVSDLAKSLGSSDEDIKNIKSYEKMVGNAIDHLICLSKDDKPILLNNMGVDDNIISVIPSGVDVDNIKYHNPNFREKTILFLGNLFFEPNSEAIDNIYEHIYHRLNNLGFKFLIVGDCPEKIKDKYKNSNFKFTGTVLDLNDIFKKSTIALAPILEGTGMRIKTLNYLSAGLPVITTSMSALGFSDKKALIIEDNFDKYPNIIIDLINNKKSALKLSKNGRSIIEKKYDWEIIAKQTKKTYKKILNNKIKNKKSSEKELANLKLNKEPIWLEETKNKGRFSKWPRILNNDFIYALIEKNKINVIKR